MEKATEKIALFVDFDNMRISSEGRKYIDLEAVKEYLSDKGLFVLGKIYFKLDGDKQEDFLRKLWNLNIKPIYSPIFGWKETNNKSKSLADPMMIVDIMETLLKNNNITTIALMTGDKDFVPIVRKIKEYGKKVILIYPENAAEILKNECSPPTNSTEEYKEYVHAKDYDLIINQREYEQQKKL